MVMALRLQTSTPTGVSELRSSPAKNSLATIVECLNHIEAKGFEYDRSGHNMFGYDRDGYDRNGYDRFGYDKTGLDRRRQPRPE
jgi:hypothetical protein